MNEQLYREAERKLWQEAGATPTEHHFHLPVAGGRVRVQELGEGPPVLFIHGGPSSGSEWAFLAARMTHFRCLMLDRPGTGLSEAPAVERSRLDDFVQRLVPELLDALGIERADQVVSSFGGYVALRAGVATPQRIGRVVQMGAPPLIPGGTVAAFMRMMAIPGLHRLIAALPASEKQILSMLRQIGHGASLDAGRIPRSFLDWKLALMSHTPTLGSELGMIASAMTLRGFDRAFLLDESFLARVETPTYFLWGEDDAFGNPEVARNLVDAMPDAELELMPRAGHLPWLDDPDQAARVVSDFLGARSDAPAGV
jgi:2-hydroxy-6-oxonona-2,4-dienedioate hydrolase